MKSRLIIAVIIILVAAWWFWPRQSISKLINPQTAQEVPANAPSPTPALPVIDQNTNLSGELNKLTLPDPSPAYQKLDELVNNL